MKPPKTSFTLAELEKHVDDLSNSLEGIRNRPRLTERYPENIEQFIAIARSRGISYKNISVALEKNYGFVRKKATLNDYYDKMVADEFGLYTSLFKKYPPRPKR